MSPSLVLKTVSRLMILGSVGLGLSGCFLSDIANFLTGAKATNDISVEGVTAVENNPFGTVDGFSKSTDGNLSKFIDFAFFDLERDPNVPQGPFFAVGGGGGEIPFNEDGTIPASENLDYPERMALFLSNTGAEPDFIRFLNKDGESTTDRTFEVGTPETIRFDDLEDTFGACDPESSEGLVVLNQLSAHQTDSESGAEQTILAEIKTFNGECVPSEVIDDGGSDAPQKTRLQSGNQLFSPGQKQCLVVLAGVVDGNIDISQSTASVAEHLSLNETGFEFELFYDITPGGCDNVPPDFLNRVSF